jgi:hypothetical protein
MTKWRRRWTTDPKPEMKKGEKKQERGTVSNPKETPLNEHKFQQPVVPPSSSYPIVFLTRGAQAAPHVRIESPPEVM